jgi:hypothetical protein
LAGEEKPGEPHGHFARLLATGCSKFGKHFQLHLPGSLALSAIPLLVAVAAVAAVCFAIGMLPSGLRIALALILAGAAVALVSWIVKLFRARQKSITQFVYGLLFALLGWIAWIHLFTTDRFYLWLGRVAPAGSGGPDKSAR